MFYALVKKLVEEGSDFFHSGGADGSAGRGRYRG